MDDSIILSKQNYKRVWIIGRNKREILETVLLHKKSIILIDTEASSLYKGYTQVRQLTKSTQLSLLNKGCIENKARDLNDKIIFFILMKSSEVVYENTENVW